MVESSIWTEKYRPQTFQEIKGQKDIVEKIRAFVESGNMPHLLFSGPAGIGKTTLSLVIAKQLFGDTWRQNTLELNASDERGIDIIRVKVKDFARTKAIGDVPFKIIYLDESDALTKDAQQALRRTMENYTKTCRFILSCVTPDTKILLPSEREMRLKEFIEQYELSPKNIHVQNISANNSNNNFTKNDVVVAAVKLPASSIGKKVLEISTMTGRKLKLTDDHKLLTTNGWKEAGTLTKEDKLLIYPNLEGTPVEDNPQKIISLAKFIGFISSTEENDGLGTIGDTVSFQKLKSEDKDKVLARILELKELVKENKGLTEREFELYALIRQSPGISREELQKSMNLTRMGLNYLLSSMNQKNYIKRIVNKKTHSFTITDFEPIILRNDMHIKKIVEKEFGIKISYTTVKKSTGAGIERGRIDRVIGELRRKELLDVSYNDIETAGALTRICGFMLGDGHLAHNNMRLHFSGNELALLEVQKDLDILGYSNYSKIKSVTLKNTLHGRTFEGTTTSFTLDSRPLSLLLQYLGIPKGDKVITPYSVPEFVMRGTKHVKREFLRALFGCDADKPSWKRMNFNALSLRQNKAKFLGKEMLQYYDQLTHLFEDFGVATYVDIINREEVRLRDNVEILTFILIIRPNNQNLFRFFSRVGYVYEKYKDNLTRLSSEYLRHKINLIQTWREKSQVAVAAVQNGCGIMETARQFSVTPDFVANQLKGKEVHLPRNEFMGVEEWIKRYKFNNLLFINEIKEIKEIKVDVVMDITCQGDHNFITNGLISHNCNYSSKIIDPIQSRCAIFRFKPLAEEEVFAVIAKVAAEEGLTISEEAKKALFVVCGGDCRRLENIMQSCAVIKQEIDSELVYSMASVAKPKEVNDFLSLAAKGNFLESRKKLLNLMLDYGLSGLDIIRQIQKEIWNLKMDADEKANDRKKVELVDKCGEVEFRMVEGSDEYIQLESFLAFVVLVGKKNA